MTRARHTGSTLSRRKALVVTGLTAVVAVAGASAAFAYWSAKGGGTGTATTAVSNATLAVTQPALSGFFPGDASQTVTATVRNTSADQKAYFSALTAQLSVTKAATAAAGTCDASDYLLGGTAGSTTTPKALTVTPVELTPGGTSTVTTQLQFNDKAVLQDACQGAVVTVTYVAS